MLPVLVPMAPSSTITFEDRTEARTRSTTGSNAGDLETDPAVRYNAVWRHGTDALTLAYTPRLLFVDETGKDHQAQILNGASAILELHHGRTSFQFATADQYGTIDPASLVIPARWKGEGTPAVIYSLPADLTQNLTYISSYSSAVLTQALSRRLNLSVSAQMGVFGGPTEHSRAELPLVYSPNGEVKLEYNASHHDDVIVTGGLHYATTKQIDTITVNVANQLDGRQVSVANVQAAPAVVGYAELRYRHKWSRSTVTEVSAGAAVAHQDVHVYPASADSDAQDVSDAFFPILNSRPGTIPYPTAEILTIYNPLNPDERPRDKVQAVFDLRSNPWFDPFAGVNQERVELSGAVNFLSGKNVLRVQGGFYNVIPTHDTPGVYTFAMGELVLERKLSKTMTLDVGVRAFRQLFDEHVISEAATGTAPVDPAKPGGAMKATGTDFVAEDVHHTFIEYIGFVGFSWQPAPKKL